MATQLYRTAIRSWTTLEMEPEAIHEIGLEELGAIEEERRVIARAAGFGDDIVAYRAALDDDAREHPDDEGGARRPGPTEDIERAMAVAPRYFGVLPRAGCEVRAVEEYKEKDAPFAYYYPPSGRRSRDGIYYANGYDLHVAQVLASSPSTTYHEAAPGHHFQITLEMENPTSSNRFRRLGSRMVGGAYVEGWGLYSERLADEMGLYRSEGERFGMLDGQAWRAARLVVDTGLHALRWERQRSIDFLLHDAGLSETDAVIETDRYICWPGQALTYKLGQRQIERCGARSPPVTGRRSTCASSTTRCSATGRCRWPPWPASCRAGWPRRPEPASRAATCDAHARTHHRRSHEPSVERVTMAGHAAAPRATPTPPRRTRADPRAPASDTARRRAPCGSGSFGARPV